MEFLASGSQLILENEMNGRVFGGVSSEIHMALGVPFVHLLLHIK